MSDSAKKNVVSLDDYGQMRRGLGKGPGTQALRDTRELAASKLKLHLGRMMEKVDDALFARAEKAENNMAQTQYFDAMREMRIIRQDIEDDFLNGFYSRFNQGVPREGSNSGELSLSFDDDSLGLIDKNDMEENLAITNMVSKTRSTCKQPLYSLDKRIGFLIRDPDLERWQNPLGPEAICDAFREASNRIETGLEIRLVIFKLFDQHVISHMDEFYKELNQQLVKLGVMPEIKTTLRKSGYTAPHPQMPTGPGEMPPEGMPTGYQDTPGYSGGSMPHYGNGAPNGAGAHGGYHGGEGQSPISALTFLQHGGAGGYNGETGDFGDSFDPAVMASGQVNILHGMKDSSVIQGMGKAGDMTIDIVAMLFDYILDDKSIPDAMRAMIGRLQIPVLKVALLEREFFSKKSHPARQLLNRLASTAVSWNEQQGTDDPLYRKIESVVQTILDEFEDDIGLFASLLEDLDDFLAKEEERADVRAERSAKVMEGQERLEVAKSTTMEEIEPRVSDTSNMAFVREFVTTHWKNLLFITCARQGKESDAWKQAVATMDDLIWSVKPKRSLEERKRLVALQPTLLTNLRAGMERLSLAPTERDEFIAKLIHAHGRTAVNAEDSEDDNDNSEAQVNDDTQPQQVQETSAAEDTGEAEETVAVAGANEPASTQAEPEPAHIDDQYSARVERMTTGTWIEFRGADGKATRAKLSWISPITNTYLFTDRQGLKAGNYGGEELAHLLRCSRAKIVNSTPLMDRAVSTVLKEYQKH